MTQEEIWQSVLAQIKLNISSANFATWFANTRISEMVGDVIVISVPNSFSKEWLEQKYKTEILRILKSVDSSIRDIEYIIAPTKQVFFNNNSVKVNEEQLGFSEFEKDEETNLNPKYDLDKLIVGPFNEMA
ncbi:MAG: DnaA N-terminal domain-containing protein, partial [Candidatus Pacebacteria bacterium]|nr:DnaA N-terminal domain-containing protein [Candidatus Paceibacterota bacterium]